MAVFSAIATAIGLVGAAAGVAGTVMQYKGQKEAAKQAERQENIRQAQSNIEAARSRRDLIRKAIVARSEAASNANAQGAGTSSGLAGGLAQVTQATGNDIAAINTGQQLGGQMFDSNRAMSAAQTRASFGSGLSNLGGSLVQNREALGRLATFSVG